MDLQQQWDERLHRFNVLRLVLEADQDWGPIGQAEKHEEIVFNLRDNASPDRKAHWIAEANKTSEAYAAALQQHMEEVWRPLVAAAIELVMAPAPDLEALRFKHTVIAGDLDLANVEDESFAPFDMIKSDAARLLA